MSEERRTPQPSTTVDTDTVVVGAGPAGLAVAACLRRLGVSFLLLEQDRHVGSAWRRHYDRLHLHTDKARSSLPHLPFPPSYPRYPSRKQMIEYLEEYARHFELEPRFGQKVVRAFRARRRWHTVTEGTLYRSRALVIATGYARRPAAPTWPGQTDFQGSILHSSQYRNGMAFEGQRVLVVGFGNSGGEIAIDLWEHGARPALSVRRPVNIIPRDLFGLPLLAISVPLSYLPARLADLLTTPILRWKFGKLSTLGLRKASYGPFTEIEQRAHIPLIDVGLVKLLKQKRVKVYPGIRQFTQNGVTFEDGQKMALDAVVLATGYHPAVNDFLEHNVALIGENGTPATSGLEAEIPGLYFCGFRVSARGVLNDIAREAKQVAQHIAAG